MKSSLTILFIFALFLLTGAAHGLKCHEHGLAAPGTTASKSKTCGDDAKDFCATLLMRISVYNKKAFSP